MNTGDVKYILRFINPNDGYIGYTNFHFNKMVWVQSQMNSWPNKPKLIDVILLSKNEKLQVKVDFEQKVVTDVTLYSEIVDNQIKPYEISVIIPAHNSKEYLGLVIDKFLEQLNVLSDINYEILVGIDNCYQTLEYVSQTQYDEKVKFYFFKENVGPYFVKNSIVTVAEYENIIFFDADDIPRNNLVKEVVKRLKNADVVRYKYNEMLEGKDPDKFPNIGFPLGSFGIKKNVFIKLGGFYTWRITADTEFKARCENSKLKIDIVDDFLMYYRIQNQTNQLTKNSFSGYGSKLRRMYDKIIEYKKINEDYKNPKYLKTSPFVRVF
jgi:glycosyltransferase involved in cell wall biosynthesis